MGRKSGGVPLLLVVRGTLQQEIAVTASPLMGNLEPGDRCSPYPVNPGPWEKAKQVPELQPRAATC